MTNDDARWCRRIGDLLLPLASWLQPGRYGGGAWKLSVYVALMRVHRLAWRCGFEL